MGRFHVKDVAIFLRQEFWLAIFSADNVGRFAGREEDLVGLAENLIRKANNAIFRFGDARTDAQEFIVPRRMVVTALNVGDDDLAVVFLLHAFIFDAKSAHQLD